MCELSKLYIEVSNTVIYPYVAIVPQLPVLKPNSIEVEDVFSVLKKFTSKNINSVLRDMIIWLKPLIGTLKAKEYGELLQ